MAQVNYGERLVNGFQLPVAQTLIYSVLPTDPAVMVDAAEVVNYGLEHAQVTLSIVQAGQNKTLGRYRVVSNRQLTPDETLILPEMIGMVIDPGGEIWGSASKIDSLAFSAAGTKDAT